jgi:hypothetical protein
MKRLRSRLRLRFIKKVEVKVKVEMGITCLTSSEMKSLD